MNSKKRLTRRDPSYYVPLPYAMAIKKTQVAIKLGDGLFEGMLLKLRTEGLINKTIAVTAHAGGEEVTLGYIPKGMVERIEGLLALDEQIAVTLERLHCERLIHSFWICFDQLPDLREFDRF